MNPSEARGLGKKLAGLVEKGECGAAWELLALILGERTPFRLLDEIGWVVGGTADDNSNAFLERITAARLEGGWVVIASMLSKRLEGGMEDAFSRCKTNIIAADIWYTTDILGERVTGAGLVLDLERALGLLSDWREDPNRWVRRTVGVAVHYWAKRMRGKAWSEEQAKKLLAFLEPMFEEHEMDAVKGVGWGLKTLGRYYPALAGEWLEEQMLGKKRHPKATMLRKALTYLVVEERTWVRGGEI